jgi:hypothetical protein
MKNISVALIMALALAACGEEKASEVASAEPAAKADEAAKPAPLAKAPEPAKPADEAVKPAEPAPAAAPADARQAPEVAQLVLDGAKKGAVTFPHQLHAGLPIVGGKCNVCHHTTDEKGTSTQKCTAPGCHDGNGKVAPKDAFHELCRGCHTKALAEQPDNAKLKSLKSCKGCHVG